MTYRSLSTVYCRKLNQQRSFCTFGPIPHKHTQAHIESKRDMYKETGHTWLTVYQQLPHKGNYC